MLICERHRLMEWINKSAVYFRIQWTWVGRRQRDHLVAQTVVSHPLCNISLFAFYQSQQAAVWLIYEPGYRHLFKNTDRKWKHNFCSVLVSSVILQRVIVLSKWPYSTFVRRWLGSLTPTICLMQCSTQIYILTQQKKQTFTIYQFD